MSEWLVSVVEIGKVGKHPDADTLSITTVKGGYPVVFKSGTFNPGDLAVHIPPDSLVPLEHPAFSFLKEPRIKFVKLRGRPSHGLLIPLAELGLTGCKAGDIVHEMIGVTKFEPDVPVSRNGRSKGGGDFLPYYDIHGLRNYERLFQPGEEVVVTEKIHGMNGRWVVKNGEVLCGSRKELKEDSVWNRMAEKYDLKRLPEGIAVFGEVYGPGCQKDFDYGATEPSVLFFDVLDTKTGRWYSPSEFVVFCSEHGLPTVPMLYEGPFDLDLMYRLAEGQTTCPDATHVREGIVVKPVTERWDTRLGRVFLKLPGEGYLLSQNKTSKAARAQIKKERAEREAAE